MPKDRPLLKYGRLKKDRNKTICLIFCLLPNAAGAVKLELGTETINIIPFHSTV